jgi:hypothetical protein
VNADGSNPQLLLTPKAATSSDPVFTNIGWTKWSPNASHLILFEKVWQENGFSNILLGTKLRRITADGRDNTVLKTDGYFPIDWVTNSDILH